ncbi:substrate-binding periplasmic protein [Psychrobium sp. nBUS_13]|uniref:substrate-binding periplasmic protein n=1 Tax=Psychrobium sp. nBUS_13 TaxID=3395319 RepID=UPI003EBA3966
MKWNQIIVIKVKCLCLTLVLSASNAFACDKTLIFGISYESWEPYYSIKGEQHTGSEIDFLKLVLADANICYKTVRVPSSERALLELKKGNIDLLLSASNNESRAGHAHFSEPYRTEYIRIFWHKSAPSKLKNATLNEILEFGFHGAVNLGSYFGPINQPLIEKSLSIRRVATLRQRIDLVSHHRVDFAIEDEAAGLQYIHCHNIENIELHPYIVHSDQVSFMFSKKSVPYSIVEKINASIKNNRDSYPDILAKYLK